MACKYLKYTGGLSLDTTHRPNTISETLLKRKYHPVDQITGVGRWKPEHSNRSDNFYLERNIRTSRPEACFKAAPVSRRPRPMTALVAMVGRRQWIWIVLCFCFCFCFLLFDSLEGDKEHFLTLNADVW
jgi:hypothetical protein